VISISSSLTGMDKDRDIRRNMVTVEKRSMVAKRLLQWVWSGAPLVE
jgi:hypothetical protein